MMLKKTMPTFLADLLIIVKTDKTKCSSTINKPWYIQTMEYYSNRMPKEYHLRSQNAGGGLYLESKKYNPAGMLFDYYLKSGTYGFDCVYAGDYQLKCRDLESGIDYYTSVEYASQYEGN